MALRLTNLTSAHNALFARIEIPSASPCLTILQLRKFISTALPRARSYVAKKNRLGMLPARWSAAAWTLTCSP